MAMPMSIKDEGDALIKARVKGHYRRNPKTGKREYVKPHDTKTAAARGKAPAAKGGGKGTLLARKRAELAKQEARHDREAAKVGPHDKIPRGLFKEIRTRIARLRDDVERLEKKETGTVGKFEKKGGKGKYKVGDSFKSLGYDYKLEAYNAKTDEWRVFRTGGGKHSFRLLMMTETIKRMMEQENPPKGEVKKSGAVYRPMSLAEETELAKSRVKGHYRHVDGKKVHVKPHKRKGGKKAKAKVSKKKATAETKKPSAFEAAIAAYDAYTKNRTPETEQAARKAFDKLGPGEEMQALKKWADRKIRKRGAEEKD